MHEKSITSFNVQDGTVKSKRMSFLKKKYIFSLIIIIIVIAAIVLAYHYGVFRKGKLEALIPPNPTKALPPSPSHLHSFKRAAVCADGVQCAEIGRNILDKNGTAVDAAIAAMFCNGLVNMQSMGIGGGFLMTIYKKSEGKAYTLNARESAPINATADMFGSDRNKSISGPLSIGVPGELKGYWEAHQKFGKLAWKDIIQPTIDLCEAGYNISVPLYDGMVIRKMLIENDELLREWYMEDGKLKKAGSIIKPKKLCETLKVIAEKGADDFYSGSIAQQLAEDLEAMGSIITLEDLKNYTVKWADPISFKFNNEDTLYSVPPPGSGVLLGFILKILDGYNFNSTSIEDIPNTVLTFHRIIEAFKYAYAKRTELGDLDFINITALMKNLTSPEYAESIRLKIRDNSTSTDPKDYGAVFYNTPDHGTAHISVLSEEGDAVSVTSSVNIYFGAGLTSNQTGILLNSGMDDFSSKGFTNFFGLPGSPNNAIEPGKKSLSSMSPTIIVNKTGDVRMVIGASGGTKIPSAIAMVTMRNLWFGQNLKEAVDAPRIHHQVYPMQIEYEYGILQQVIDGLEKLGHKTQRYRDRGSVICALLKQGENIIANADYRKNGEVYGLN